MSAGVSGSTVYLEVRTSTGPDVYVLAGGQRGLSLGRDRTVIGTSGKGDGDGFALAGRRGVTITMDGLVIASDAGRTALLVAYEGDGVGRLRQTAVGAEPARQCSVLITDIEDDFPDDDAATWTVELLRTGPWQVVSDGDYLITQAGDPIITETGAYLSIETAA